VPTAQRGDFIREGHDGSQTRISNPRQSSQIQPNPAKSSQIVPMNIVFEIKRLAGPAEAKPCLRPPDEGSPRSSLSQLRSIKVNSTQEKFYWTAENKAAGRAARGEAIFAGFLGAICGRFLIVRHGRT
jgi:hypothetical protein